MVNQGTDCNLSNKSGILIYDGECRFCCFFVGQRADFFNNLGIQLLPSQGALAIKMLAEAKIERIEGIILIRPDSRVFQGAVTIIELMRLAKFNSLANLLSWGPFGWLFKSTYNFIARNRYRFCSKCSK